MGSYQRRDGEIIYTREKLYEEVWADPVTVVAKRYGLSDVAIHKICKRLSIPVPPRGYWAKLKAGKRVKRSPLPKTDGPSQTYSLARPSKPEPEQCEMEIPKQLAFLDETMREKVITACSDIKIKDRLIKPHHLIVQDREARVEDKRRRREEHRLVHAEYGYGRIPQPTGIFRYYLDLRVPDEQLHRAYLILDALFRTLELLGEHVKVPGATVAVLMGEPVKFGMSGKPDELKVTIDEYYGPRKNWRDTKRQTLEGQIGDIIIGLYECAHALRTVREEREREERQRRLEEKRRHDRARNQHEEMARYQALENAAMDWHKARILGEYVAELERIALMEPDEEKRSAQIQRVTWGKAKVEWLDPTTAREDPILGKRRHTQPEGEKVILEQYNRHAWFGDIETAEKDD